MKSCRATLAARTCFEIEVGQLIEPQALASGDESPQLVFIEANCVQCGLCCRTCPEDAIAATPRYLYDHQQRTARRVLHEAEPFLCISCGKPFATQSVVSNMLAKLEGHWMFQDERAKRRLMMCEDCRVVDIVQDPQAMEQGLTNPRRQ